MTLHAYMPSPAACPISLVNEVRVQRLLDIPEQDAEAEGVRHFVKESHGVMSFEGLHGADRTALVCSVYGSHRDAFRRLWEYPNRPVAWAANPWGAAINLIVQCANIDALDTGAAA